MACGVPCNLIKSWSFVMFSHISACLRAFSLFISSWLKFWRNGLLHLLSLSLCCQPFQLLAATSRATDTRTKAAAANVLLPVPLQQSTLTLSPTSATHVAGTGRCIVATYTNASGQAVRGVSVSFSVTGANATTGTVSTDWAGQATFVIQARMRGTIPLPPALETFPPPRRRRGVAAS